MTTRRGYLATWVGSLAGVAMLGALTGGLVFVLNYKRCDPNGFDCLGAAISVVLLGMVGAAIGAVLGAHAALRFRSHEAAGRTAWCLLGLLALSVGVIALVANSLKGSGSADGGVWGALIIIELVLVPLAARWIALATVRKPRSDASVEI